MRRQKLYGPKDTGFEREIAKRLQYWDTLRQKKTAASKKSEKDSDT